MGNAGLGFLSLLSAVGSWYSRNVPEYPPSGIAGGTVPGWGGVHQTEHPPDFPRGILCSPVSVPGAQAFQQGDWVPGHHAAKKK